MNSCLDVYFLYYDASIQLYYTTLEFRLDGTKINGGK